MVLIVLVPAAHFTGSLDLIYNQLVTKIWCPQNQPVNIARMRAVKPEGPKTAYEAQYTDSIVSTGLGLEYDILAESLTDRIIVVIANMGLGGNDIKGVTCCEHHTYKPFGLELAQCRSEREA